MVQEEETRARAAADAARAIKDECEADLAEVLRMRMRCVPVHLSPLLCAVVCISIRPPHLSMYGLSSISTATNGDLAHTLTMHQAVPILYDALAALDTIKEADIA